ncbi:LOW QUALITY PROTEIN: nuclear pore complex protein Nup160-like [Dugong dugon]
MEEQGGDSQEECMDSEELVGSNHRPFAHPSTQLLRHQGSRTEVEETANLGSRGDAHSPAPAEVAPPGRLSLAARAGIFNVETSPGPPPALRTPGKGGVLPAHPHSLANSVAAQQWRKVRPACLLPAFLDLFTAPLAPSPEVTTSARPCLCPVGPRDCGGKMAAAGAVEPSFLELSGAKRERLRHFPEFTVCGVGTVNAVAGRVKYGESAGDFYYLESGRLFSVTRSRFIHWKTSGDTLEPVEESLDVNLLNNAVHLKFQNCSILPRGVYVSETENHVIILTDQTAHRLLLPHPSRMYRSVSWLFPKSLWLHRLSARAIPLESKDI